MQANGRWLVLVVLLALGALLWWQFADGAPDEVHEPWKDEPVAEQRAKQKPKDAAGDQEAKREELEGKDASKSEEKKPEASGDSKTGSLLLRVIYGTDKSPASGVRMRVRPIKKFGKRPKYEHYRTDEKGEIRIADLPPGKVWVIPARNDRRPKAPVIEAGKETEYVFELKDGITLTGIVVDKDGVPVPNASILFARWAGAEAREVTTSNAQGRFGLREVSRTVNVGARAAGYTPSPMKTVMAGKGAEIDVRLVLPAAGGSVRGTVVDDTGRTIAGADVRVGFLGRASRVITLPDGTRGHKAMAVITKTDAKGRFEAKGLPASDVPIQIRADEHAPHHGTVEVVAHAPTEETFRLERGAVCVGKVRNHKGEPLGGIEVTHDEYDSPKRRATRTEEDGTYRLAGLPSGLLDFRIRTEKQGTAETKLQARPGETIRWDVTLSRGHVIEGTVTDEDGKPLKDAYVEAVGPRIGKGRSRWFRFVATDAQGRFELIDVPRDETLEMTVQAREHRAIRRQRIKTSVTRLDYKLKYLGKPTARVVGLLLDPDGKPVANAQVSVAGNESGGGLRPTTKDGRILIEKMYPGRYTLLVKAGAFPRYRSEPFDLAAGATHDVGRVQLIRGGYVKFELTRPKTKFYLSLYKSDGKTYAGAYISTAKDPIRSEPIAPGRYVVRTTGKSIVRRDVPVVIEEGKETLVRLSIDVGVPCEFEFELPVEIGDRERLTVNVTGKGYATVLSAYRSRKGGFQCSAGLPPGKFKLVVISKLSHKGTREFEVVAGQTNKIKTALK